MIGFGYAARHPERIARVVVLNTAAFRLPPTKKFPWALRLGRNSRFGAWLIRRCNMFCRSAARVCVKKSRLSAEVRAAYLQPYDSWQNRIAVWKFVQTIPLREGDVGFDIVQDVESSLPKFRDVPMLICWGLRDFVFSHHFLTEWERHFPKAEVHRFDDCGHYILEDARAEVIANVRRFLGM